MPVRHDERHLGCLAHVGHRLVRKVADFDPAVRRHSAFLGVGSMTGSPVAISVEMGETGSGGLEEYGLVSDLDGAMSCI